MMAPLTELTKCGPTKNASIEWTPAWTNVFQQMKVLIAKETILTYPYFSKNLTIHTDTSDVQLGAAIVQESKPFFYFLKNHKNRK